MRPELVQPVLAAVLAAVVGVATMSSQGGWDWVPEPPGIRRASLVSDPPTPALPSAVREQPEGWRRVASLAIPRYGLAVVGGGDGRIYAIGGVLTRAPWYSDAVEVYSPELATWERLAPLALPAGRPGAAVGMDGRIYVAGGEGSRGVLDVLQIYDPAQGTWRTGPHMPTGRSGVTVVAGRDGRIYAISGCMDSDCPAGRVDTVEAYDPSTNLWTTAAVGDPEDGRVLIGEGSSNDLWIALPSLPSEQLFPSMVLGADKRVYAVGGRARLAGEWHAVNSVYQLPESVIRIPVQ
jgi:hypothetical protein